MVELLDPGTEAETCLMAGRGMNGLKGTIVCYNPNNQRYTLELEAGDMMSLRIRNVKAIKNQVDGDTSPQREDKNAAPSSLPGAPTVTNPEKPQEGGESNKAERNNINSIFETASFSTIFFVVVIAYLYIHSDFYPGTNGTQSDSTKAGSPLPFQDISSPVMIACGVFAFLAWDWGTKPGLRARGEFKISNLLLRASHVSIFEILMLGGLVLWAFDQSIYNIVGAGVFVFFVWQFGTNNGRRAFSWNNVENRVRYMNIWEVVFFAGFVERVLHILDGMAGGRRRR